MRRRRRFELRSSQRSVRYYVPDEERGGRAHPDYFSELYPHMLLQDISASILPIGGRAGGKLFRVGVAPEDERAERLVAQAIGRHGQREGLGLALYDFVGECAQLVVALGEAHYELVYFFDRESGNPVEFGLALIQPGSMRHRKGKFVQDIPASVARERRLPVHVELPDDSVLVFHLPDPLRKDLRRAMESLVAMGRQTFPPFILQRGPDESAQAPRSM